MQIDATRVFQNTMHHKQTFCHIRGIRQHFTFRNMQFKARDDFGGRIGRCTFDACDAFSRLSVPKPHIIKRFYLRVVPQSRVTEYLIVLAFGVEWWVKTDKVNTSVWEVCHDVKAVTIVKCVGFKTDVHSFCRSPNFRFFQCNMEWIGH